MADCESEGLKEKSCRLRYLNTGFTVLFEVVKGEVQPCWGKDALEVGRVHGPTCVQPYSARCL